MMDKKIARQRIVSKHWRAILAFTLLLCLIAYAYLSTAQGKTHSISKQHLNLAKVSQAQFETFIALNGQVTPKRTVYLDAIEGGRVDKLFVEAGSFVVKDQPLILLTNTSLQLDVISREAQIVEQLNNLSNTRLAMAQDKLDLKRDMIDVNYQLTRLKLLMSKNKTLLDKKLIAEHEYLALSNEYDYYRQRLDISKQRSVQDEKVRKIQIAQLEGSTQQLNKNLIFARNNLENLLVKAPVDGYLTGLAAELGESKARGVRLGQIDNLDSFKVISMVDEFYISGVQPGQIALAKLNDKDYQLVIKKIYPQVSNGQFKVDLTFSQQVPKALRRGQNIQLKLQLGAQQDAVLLPRGGFHHQTGGNWIFVVSQDGQLAQRRPIKLGRSNPNFYEVLSGLTPGEQVITSSYSDFETSATLSIE